MKLGFVFILIAIISCNQKAKIPEDFDYGKIENGIYKNKYFEFEIPVPETWHVQSKEQIEKMRKKGNEIIAETNSALAEEVKASEVKSATLLTAYKNRADTIMKEYNPGFSIMVESLGSTSMVKDGKEYLTNVKKIMEQSGMSFSYPSGFYSEKIGNKKFDAMDVVMRINGLDIDQTYYSIIDKNFAFAIIISSIGKEQKETLNIIVNKIKFN